MVRADGARAGRAHVLGILGGMGPLATADFYRRLVERTPATRDQEHLPVVIWADPGVPDRTAALVERAPSPLPALVEGARRLRRAGATVVAVPCNTAHAFIAPVAKAAGVEVLDMVGAAMREAVRLAVGGGGVGVLATNGTRAARLYERAAPAAVEVVQVRADVQRDCVDAAIGLVKGGGDLGVAAELIADATRELRRQGAEVAVAACTEIPLVSGAAMRVLPVLDSTDALVDAALVRMGRLPA